MLRCDPLIVLRCDPFIRLLFRDSSIPINPKGLPRFARNDNTISQIIFLLAGLTRFARNDNGIGDCPQFFPNFTLTLSAELSILTSLRGEFGG
jgi:hypothetical protein